MGLLQASMQNTQVSLPNVRVNPSWDGCLLGARRILYLTETELRRLELTSFKVSPRRAQLITLLCLSRKLGHLRGCSGAQELVFHPEVLRPMLSSPEALCLGRLRGL